MFKLHEVVSLVKKRKRVARGGSRGGQAGKGGKGQTARSGGSIKPGFEGGQMPLHRRLPKRGFNNKAFSFVTKIINLADLERAFNPNEVVDQALLREKKVIKTNKNSITKLKLLGEGMLTKKLHIIVDGCSEAAKLAVEKVGGTVTIQRKKE
ncbi:MAG TPA: 50S ribosomal protein L15 [Patescibacteria group bacterium]|jgi:large subunit ribosomal protein L15|nr:50S ribosomal protein L15 [Patescibacteria group bacterium]